MHSNLRKGYLFHFLSGHGGDFFITLASKCSRNFVGAWHDDKAVITRMNEFVITGKMPGNNIGKKLIDGTWQDYKKSISNELIKLDDNRPNISFCTHPGQNQVDIKPHLEDWLNIPIQEIHLIPTTQQSLDWMDFHYDPIHAFQQYSSDEGIDHIDLLLNNEKQLDWFVQDIGENLNWEWVNIVKRYYRDVKVNPFLKNYGL